MDSDKRKGLTYKDAGVDIDAQDEALRRIRGLVKGTRTPGVLADLGSFGGLFSLDLAAYEDPVLVSSCDGIGTKLKLAFDTGIHDTVGRDLVNHCVDDILVQGARPQFFMDYIATGRLEPGVLASVVEGIAAGCREAGCALLGGETAEMPGFYGDGEYDVAGFIVGLVDRKAIIDGSAIRPGDILIGLPSAGLHTNGFSLARKICFEVAGLEVNDTIGELGRTAAEVLLSEHRSYLHQLRLPVERGWIAGLAHVTGGGMTDNIPRILPEGTAAEVRLGSWPVLPEFPWMQRLGRIPEDDLYRTFNMGVGMVVVACEERAEEIETHLDGMKEPHFRIGSVVEGDGRVRYV
jgi:phosphoribosylformylglycinamidine cyclo-ligase